MGSIMKEMGNYMQIFAITHLPQVASKGNQHFKVTKYDNDQITVSEIKLLDKEERIQEIAQMLSGNTITDAALQHARQLLRSEERRVGKSVDIGGRRIIKKKNR